MATDAGRERLITLAETLVAKTNSGSIRWTWAADGQDSLAFRYETGNATVVSETVDHDGLAPYRLSILNREGIEVEALEWASASGANFQAVRDLLTNLYDAARRNALDSDSVIKDLFDDLSET